MVYPEGGGIPFFYRRWGILFFTRDLALFSQRSIYNHLPYPSMSHLVDHYPDDITILDLSYKELTELPDISRFTELTEFYCYNNYLTTIPPLNPRIRVVYCHNNRLTSLPPFNPGLEIVFCCNNRLTSLPPFNPELRVVYCYNNELDILPPLNDLLVELQCQHNKLILIPRLTPNLELFYSNHNPIYDIIQSNDISVVRYRLGVFDRVRELFYLLKYKRAFRYWLWELIREPKIRAWYHPSRLSFVLDGVDDDDADGFDLALDRW